MTGCIKLGPISFSFLLIISIRLTLFVKLVSSGSKTFHARGIAIPAALRQSATNKSVTSSKIQCLRTYSFTRQDQ